MLSYLLGYLQDCKSNIRIAQKTAMTPKKKAKGKKDEPTEPEKPIDTCILFYSKTFPEYQKRVLEILSTYEFVDNVI